MLLLLNLSTATYMIVRFTVTSTCYIKKKISRATHMIVLFRLPSNSHIKRFFPIIKAEYPNTNVPWEPEEWVVVWTCWCSGLDSKWVHTRYTPCWSWRSSQRWNYKRKILRTKTMKISLEVRKMTTDCSRMGKTMKDLGYR